MSRVVVTGLGMVPPLGTGHKANWERLTNGVSGLRAIEHFDVSDLPAKIAGVIPLGTDEPHKFDFDSIVTPKDRRRMDDFIVYALAVATEAVNDAGWTPEDEESRERTGVMIGSGIGGGGRKADTPGKLGEEGPRRARGG